MKQNRVAVFRKAHNMSQEDLAASAGITRTQVSNIERGIHAPTIETASRICKAFNATLDQVFGDALNEVFQSVS